MRDGCNFVATPPGMTFASRVAEGPDDAIYFAASDRNNDTKIYKSTDDGMSFPVSAEPGMPDWWQSLVVARSDATRIYLSGFQQSPKCTMSSSNPGTSCTKSDDCPGGTCEQQKEFLLFKSSNGGTSYEPMAMTGISPTSQNSAIEIVGVDPENADIVYARVTLENATSGDSIYKSIDAGTTWTKILSKSSNIGGLSFLVRNDGSCVAGTRDIGAWKSATCEPDSWEELTNAPHVGCLYENSLNEVWACTQNTASPQLGITADGFGLMKSVDLETWTGVLRFQDIEAPVSCPAGTVQEDRCVQRYMDEQSQWCCLTTQLGIDSTEIDCTGALQCFGQLPEPASDAGMMVKKPSDGCCGASGGAPPLLLTLLVAGTLLFRRRRPKER